MIGKLEGEVTSAALVYSEHPEYPAASGGSWPWPLVL